MGSGSWVSGQHFGGPLEAVVRLVARKDVVKVRGEKVELELFLAEIVGMYPLEIGNVVTRKEKAKQTIEARDSIESPIAVSTFGVHVCESSIEEDEE